MRSVSLSPDGKLSKGRRGILTHPGLSWTVIEQPEPSVQSTLIFFSDGQILALLTNLISWSWAWKRDFLRKSCSNFPLCSTMDVWASPVRKKTNMGKACGPHTAVWLPPKLLYQSLCSETVELELGNPSSPWHAQPGSVPGGPTVQPASTQTARAWVRTWPQPPRSGPNHPEHGSDQQQHLLLQLAGLPHHGHHGTHGQVGRRLSLGKAVCYNRTQLRRCSASSAWGVHV